MSGEGRLAVRVLGGVELTVDDRSVDLGGALPRAIVAHLAMECGRVVSVERLIDRLWGDDPPRTPLGTLQSYVSRLRRAIEPAHGAGSAPRVLVSEAPGYRLVVERGDVDAHRFVDLAERARQLLESGEPAESIQAADAALALWRGEPLAGLGPDEQVRPIVVPLDERHDATIELRFEAQLLLGQHAAAIPALQAAAEATPLRERRWALLAQALYRDGRQADALRSLATAREHLVEQLGLDPGPELRELERRILAQDPDLLHAPPQAQSAASPVAAPATAAPVAPTRSLVGRQREWAQLAASLDRASSGTAQLVLLEGEPGIGKSTLCDALVSSAAERGWRTAVGRCVEAGLAPTLWPAVEIVRSLVRERDTTAAVAGNPLFRFVVEQVPPTSAPTSVELVDHFVGLLDELVSEPLLIVIDDLHWADRATLDVVTVAAQRLGSRPVVVLAAFRPPELVPGTLLAEALGRFRRLPAVTLVDVAPLAAPEVAELMAQTAGAEPTSDVAEHVRQRTGGNPLFVTELSRLAGERGVADASAVPAGIRDVVRERLAQLPERATAELEVAAIVGERFTLRTVIAASDRGADSCLDALDAAIVTRILVPDGDDGYRFAHALVRDAVLADLSPMRRERLHAAVADAIVAVHGEGPDVAEPVAFHRLAARTILDPVDVAEAALRAADVARWKNALDQSEQLSESTLAILSGAPRSPRARRAEIGAIEALISILYRRGGDHAQLVDRVTAIAARSHSESAEALALFLRFGQIDELADLRDLEPLVAQIRELAERTVEPYAVVTIRYMLCAWELLRGHVDVAVREAALGYDASGAPGPDDQPDHVPLVMLPFIAGIATALRGDAVKAHEHIDRRMRAWLALRSEVDHAAAHNVSFSSAFIDALLGDANAVFERAQRYVAVGNHGVFPEQDHLFAVFATWASARVTGSADFQRAYDALATLEASTEVVLHAALKAFLAEAHLLCGHRDAIEMLQTARAQAEARHEVWWLSEIVRLQALAEARFGDRRRAIDLVDEALRIAEDQGAALLVERIAATSGELRASDTTG